MFWCSCGYLKQGQKREGMKGVRSQSTDASYIKFNSEALFHASGSRADQGWEERRVAANAH